MNGQKAKYGRKGHYYVEIKEERVGEREKEGFVEPTYNCYAGLGYEVADDLARTGRVIAWAGNNADGVVEIIEDDDLDSWLRQWDHEWQEEFEKEGVL